MSDNKKPYESAIMPAKKHPLSGVLVAALTAIPGGSFEITEVEMNALEDAAYKVEWFREPSEHMRVTLLRDYRKATS